MAKPPQRPPQVRILPYRKPTLGRDYWILDDALPNPEAVRARSLARDNWEQGYPYKPESWPGMRTSPALTPEELAPIESWVMQSTGAKKLWVQQAPDGKKLNHNCIQVVGVDDSEPRPHTDSRSLCRYAAVLYLNPKAPDHCGTAFYRQQLPDGRLGGNTVPPPHDNMVDALGTRFVAPDAFVEDVRVPHRFNRMLLYGANMLHSAAAYCGIALEDQRMTALFFWMI